ELLPPELVLLVVGTQTDIDVRPLRTRRAPGAGGDVEGQIPRRTGRTPPLGVVHRRHPLLPERTRVGVRPVAGSGDRPGQPRAHLPGAAGPRPRVLDPELDLVICFLVFQRLLVSMRKMDLPRPSVSFSKPTRATDIFFPSHPAPLK